MFTIQIQNLLTQIISGPQKFLWPKFFGQNIFFWQKIFWTKYFFSNKNFFGLDIFFRPKIFFQKYFSDKIYYPLKKIFGPNIILDKKFFGSNIYLDQAFFRTKIILEKKKFGKKNFFTNFLVTQIFLPKFTYPMKKMVVWKSPFALIQALIN